METPEKETTIAGLWESLSRQISDLEYRQRTLSSAEFSQKTGVFDTRDEFLENCEILDRLPAEISKNEGWLKTLRQQLLERAKKVYDSDGYYTEFMVCEGILDSWFCLPNGGRSSAKRQDDITTTKEFTAAYAFWAWELEQMEIESKAKK